jgi:hypothetical protein
MRAQGPAKKKFKVRWLDTICMVATSLIVGWFVLHVLTTMGS